MSNTYWLKQDTSNPLFPDIVWSRPESKSGAGKLAIIGGHSHAFGAPGIAWQSSLNSGVGDVKVLLPDAVKKILKHVLPSADYAPSNPSGSFSKLALNDLLSIAGWSDGTLLAGDLGRNSETAMLLESFAGKYSGLLAIAHDAVDYFKESPETIINRPNTAIFASLSQVQRLFIATPTITPITYGMSPLKLAEALHDYTKEHKIIIVTKHNDMIFIASSGQIISSNNKDKVWRVNTASKATVFWIQNPTKPLESIATSLIESQDQ